MVKAALNTVASTTESVGRSVGGMTMSVARELGLPTYTRNSAQQLPAVLAGVARRPFDFLLVVPSTTAIAMLLMGGGSVSLFTGLVGGVGLWLLISIADWTGVA